MCLFVVLSSALTDDDIRELQVVDPGAAVLTSLENSDTDTASSDTDTDEHRDLPEPLTALFNTTHRKHFIDYKLNNNLISVRNWNL